MRKKSGFTLIEIIIVVALTLFLLVVTIQGMVNSSAQFTFNNEAEKIQAMIRTARSLAISGKAQLDYTDYNNNTCTDDAGTTSPPKCVAPEYVTPANYGVAFHKTLDGKSGLALFVDNHSKASLNGGKEGDYSIGVNVDGYRKGYDFFLDTFTLPEGMHLILPYAESLIFFSPIFADVSTSPPPTDQFFTFGISQKQGGVARKRCWKIQILAGISEPITEPASVDPDKCP